MLQLIKRYLKYAKATRLTAVLVLLTMLVSPLFGAAMLKLTANMTDEVFVHRRFELLAGFVIAYVAIVVARSALGFLRGYLDTYNVQRISQEVRCDAYNRLLALGEDGLGQISVGEAISTLDSDVGRIPYMVYGLPIGLLAKASSIVVYGAMMFALSWKLTLCALAIVPALAFISSRALPISRRYARICRKRRARLFGLIEERLNAARLVREYGSLAREAALFRARSDQMRRTELKAAIVGACIGAVTSLATLLGGLLILWVGASEIHSGALTVGTTLAFMGSAGLLQSPIKGFARSANRLARARVSAERLGGIVDTPTHVTETSDARPLPAADNTIEVRDASFAYPGRPEVLSRVSLRIEPGETVAIVGASGAGKSTLAGLICRRRDPSDGEVLIGGQDLKDTTFASIARTVRVVDQDPVLLRGTVADNIRYGDPGASRADVERAVAAAGAGAFIRSLPNGLATAVGHRGGRLSGGQRQRISLARALLTDCPVLVLDEATSAVDSETEAVVRDALTAERGRRSIILIGHRLSSVRYADRVVVLDQGRIVEAGTADQLLAAGGRFAELFADQARPLARAA
ncbi:MAG TPA: ABC transporter ATP-binding protein [Caulobacteraceae bacterium]|jgi:ABC-type multidrug transport system fused ATPase/permease subunit